jgi:succinoglycan biosynthesis protein ExoO
MKPLIRKSFLNKHDLKYDPKYISGQDFLFYASIFVHNPHCVVTSYAGYYYRRREASVSRSGLSRLRGHALLTEQILGQHRSALSERSQAALARRVRYFTRVADLQQLKGELRIRNWREAFEQICTKPHLAKTLVSTMLGRIRAR